MAVSANVRKDLHARKISEMKKKNVTDGCDIETFKQIFIFWNCVHIDSTA